MEIATRREMWCLCLHGRETVRWDRVWGNIKQNCTKKGEKVNVRKDRWNNKNCQFPYSKMGKIWMGKTCGAILMGLRQGRRKLERGAKKEGLLTLTEKCKNKRETRQKDIQREPDVRIREKKIRLCWQERKEGKAKEKKNGRRNI